MNIIHLVIEIYTSAMDRFGLLPLWATALVLAFDIILMVMFFAGTKEKDPLKTFVGTIGLVTLPGVALVFIDKFSEWFPTVIL